MASQEPPIKGVALRVPFSVFDYSGNLLVGAAFGTIRVDKDFGGQATAVNTVVSEGNGEYSLVLTAAEMGADVVFVTIPVTSYPDITIAIRTAAYNFDTVMTGLLDLANAVDTYTLREMFRVIGAALAGKSSGGPGSPVYRAIDDSKARITATATTDGDRTAVTLDAT